MSFARAVIIDAFASAKLRLPTALMAKIVTRRVHGAGGRKYCGAAPLSISLSIDRRIRSPTSVRLSPSKPTGVDEIEARSLTYGAFGSVAMFHRETRPYLAQEITALRGD